LKLPIYVFARYIRRTEDLLNAGERDSLRNRIRLKRRFIVTPEDYFLEI